MKKTLKYIFVAGISAALFTSCKKDYLDPVPQTSIVDLTAFDQPYRIANQVLSLYGTLKGGTFYGGRYIVYGDIRGEEFLSEDPNLVTNRDVWELNANGGASAIVGLWAQAYLTINRCNVFIEGMNLKGKSVVGDALGNQYIAEARLVRALSYYSLLQYYAMPYADKNGGNKGLPLRLTGIVGPGSSDLARSTVGEVYAQVLDDLNFAESNLPATYTGTTAVYTNTTRAHKNTAIALKTRVYLSMQDYAKVVTEANKIISGNGPTFTATSGVPHTLAADITTVFKPPYVGPESIFSMPFTTTTGDFPGTQNTISGYYLANTTTAAGSIFSLNPAGITANTGWKPADKRRSFVFAPASGPFVGKTFLSKFPNGSPADYAPVIRWAEVLLNLAEAKVRTTNSIDAQALALLNAVRNRSDATTTFVPGDFATPNDLINTILTERRIEFLGEGLRNNDLMRLLQTIPAKGTAPAKTPSQGGYIWPVSNDEKSLNKLWVD